MKKILIWNSFPIKKRNGGPPTYLYNFNEGLNLIYNNDIKIVFLGDLLNINVDIISEDKNKFVIWRVLPKFIINNIRLFKYLITLKISKPLLSSKELSEFDAIHFHLSIDVFKNRNSLKDFKGKILLTSHSPKPAWIETIEDIYNLEINQTLPLLKNKIEEYDLWSFKRASHLIFPCEESIEPYLNWERYKNEIHILKKYEYIQTGISKVNYKIDRKAIRKRLNIPEEAIVFSFIGRHSIIKGYDLLKDLGKLILDENPNLYFLIAGKEDPLEGIKHRNWIEVGWTDDPHSYVNASDIFVLPNKQTYFDLVLLEILSLGIPIVLSETGGNKHFKKYLKSGLFFFEGNNLESLYNIIKLIINKKSDFHLLGELNNSIYYDNYTLELFTKKYIELYKSLLY